MDRDKSELEKKVEEGIYGRPELKKDEKNRFLGEFRERVIKYLTFSQIQEDVIYPEILEAVRHPQAARLIIDRDVEIDQAHKYIEKARKHNLAFKRVHSPSFKGDTALVVVGNRAVNVAQRKVMDREKRLKKLGISDNIIKNVGGKLCNDCWQELKEKAPEELINYKKMSWIDRLLQIECESCGNN